MSLEVMKPQLSKNCSTTKNVFSSSGASQSLSSFICTFDIYNLALFYPNNFVKLTRISIKVMKDLCYFGHLHLKRQMKNGPFLPSLAQFFWAASHVETWSIFSASHVEFCRPPKINHRISTRTLPALVSRKLSEKDFTFLSGWSWNFGMF